MLANHFSLPVEYMRSIVVFCLFLPLRGPWDAAASPRGWSNIATSVTEAKIGNPSSQHIAYDADLNLKNILVRL